MLVEIGVKSRTAIQILSKLLTVQDQFVNEACVLAFDEIEVTVIALSRGFVPISLIPHSILNAEILRHAVAY